VVALLPSLIRTMLTAFVEVMAEHGGRSAKVTWRLVAETEAEFG
jgi:hypothetical protein